MVENETSQRQLAKVLNVKQQTISRYITGEREPNMDMVIEIARFFNVTVGQLLGTEEY
ncbi:MAG: helix-turn-helix domain-containing protein [Firmicutes bacterium]|nr:helix-turn-helix domain-containing protein [Bacillota bacterium]